MPSPSSPSSIMRLPTSSYLVHLSTVQKVARGTHTIALRGIKFFYQHTLVRPWTVLDVARPKGDKKLPVVLSRDEVWRILDAMRIDVYRVCLTTMPSRARTRSWSTPRSCAKRQRPCRRLPRIALGSAAHPGILAVLHTWTRTMEYHPHAHLLVTAGGLASDGSAWVKPTHPRFLMPGYALAPIFRAKMRTALSRAGLAQDVDPIVWAKAV